VPELTLTTDGDTLSGMAAQSAGRPLTPGAQPGGTTSTLQDVGGSPDGRSSHSPSISNLHFNKISRCVWRASRIRAANPDVCRPLSLLLA